MTSVQAFATFGLPALAIGAGLVALWANHRSAERIREAGRAEELTAARG